MYLNLQYYNIWGYVGATRIISFTKNVTHPDFHFLHVSSQKRTIYASNCNIWEMYNILQLYEVIMVVGHKWVTKAVSKAKCTLKKFMVTVWLSTNGMIHYRFLKPGTYIKVDMYCKELGETIQKPLVGQPIFVN